MKKAVVKTASSRGGPGESFDARPQRSGISSLGMTADIYAGVVPALGRAAAARMDGALGSMR